MHPPLFNRELSWLEFNRRVLAEAEDVRVPLLERVKFLAITASNLDEFLMVRVGGVRQLVARTLRERSPDGMTPKQQLKAIRDRTRALLRDMYAVQAALATELALSGIHVVSAGTLTKKQLAALSDEYHTRIGPVLTPLSVDPGHPLPFLPSGSLNLAVLLGSSVDVHTAFIRIPRMLPRFIAVPGSNNRFVPIEDVIRLHAAEFFPGLTVREVVPFRVTRDADIALREDEVEDLLKSVESELRSREKRAVVWLEVTRDVSDEALDMLQRELEIVREDVFLAPGLLKISDWMDIYLQMDMPKLKDEAFSPRIPADLATREDIFSIVRAHDILLHRPYDSYAAVVDFVQSAADDPDVIAIKQTLYRTEPGSVVVDALARAAEKGKQVTVIVEVQARFDEERNIAWARRLEEVGVQVVYGLVGLKTHMKACLVIRREGGELRRYAHLSTGNYNARTARLYTDLDLLTANPDITEDVSQLLNMITGYSASTAHEMFEHHSHEWRWKRLVVAPLEYHAWVLRMIDREIQHARAGRPARIVGKMNSLVDARVIEALTRAAEAGVSIDLAVRGICCLVPRDGIRVVSVIDRFLEHSRIFLFHNGGEKEVYVASGDWMPRNFFRRIEIAFPILNPTLRDRLELQILGISLADDAKAWRLQPDGTWRRRKASARPIRSQQRFIDIARAEAVKLPGPYEESVRKATVVRKKAGKKVLSRTPRT